MKNFLIAVLSGLVFTSCIPATPQARIQQSPQKFDALSPKHRELVQQGQIDRGMGMDAVYLAWGAPSAKFQGSKKGKATERWDYAGSRPIHTTSFYGAYGYGYGYGYSAYGPYRDHGYYGFGPNVAYVPYRLASVWFINGSVDSWERAR